MAAHGVCGVMGRGGVSQRHVGNVCGVLRSYEKGRFASATWQEVGQREVR